MITRVDLENFDGIDLTSFFKERLEGHKFSVMRCVGDMVAEIWVCDTEEEALELEDGLSDKPGDVSVFVKKDEPKMFDINLDEFQVN